MDWQVYWRSWGWNYTKAWDDAWCVYWNYLIVGPLQFRWVSLKKKNWNNA